MTSGGTCAVVPSKGAIGAKKRLSGIMSEDLRGAFAMAMLEDVLATLSRVPNLDAVLVVTGSSQAADLARTYGARVLAEDAPGGHTAAVAHAIERMRKDGAAAVLAVPGDIPLVTPADIHAILSAGRTAPSFVIVPSWDERGSNAVLAAPPDVVPLQYGDDSFLPHLARAEGSGVVPTVLRLPRIALDIDTPRDLEAFLKERAHTRARGLLVERSFTPIAASA